MYNVTMISSAIGSCVENVLCQCMEEQSMDSSSDPSSTDYGKSTSVEGVASTGSRSCPAYFIPEVNCISRALNRRVL